MTSLRDQIRAQLAHLKMLDTLDPVDSVLSRIDSGQISAIRPVVDPQISVRNNRRVEAAMRSSRLPTVRQISDFGFPFSATEVLPWSQNASAEGRASSCARQQVSCLRWMQISRAICAF